MKRTRKGFTLVELLIVIAILGALASMMTLSGTNATLSAEAAKVISNLNTLKTAGVMFYTDYMYSKDTNANWEAGFKAHSDDYIDAAALKELRKSYYLKVVSIDDTAKDPGTAQLYVGYLTTTSNHADQIKRMLRARASEYSLLAGKAGDSDAETTPDKIVLDLKNKATQDYTGGSAAFIRVR